MNRRTALVLAGTAGATGLAGCLDDITDDNSAETAGSDGDSGESNTSTSTDGEPRQSVDGPERSPEEAVSAFYEAVADDDVEQANQLTDGENVGPFTEADLDGAPTIEEITTVDADEQTATVETLLSPDGSEHTVQLLLDLEQKDTAWQIVGLDATMDERETELAPRAVFETGRANGRRTITHSGGDHIQASNLFIRGEGLETTGSWAALDGETGDDEQVVTVGNSVTVSVDNEYSLRVVWEDGDTAVVLLSVAGASDSRGASDDTETIDDDTDE